MFAVLIATRLFLSARQHCCSSSACSKVSTEWTSFSIVVFTFEKSVFLIGFEHLIAFISISICWVGGGGPLSGCVVQQLTTQHWFFFLFYCFLIPSFRLIFLWTAFTWDILSNCSWCIWGGSASSRTQTGCEVLCLLGFLCDWPQCLVFRHWLSSHLKGGGKKQGGGALHVHHMYSLLMR